METHREAAGPEIQKNSMRTLYCVQSEEKQKAYLRISKAPPKPNIMKIIDPRKSRKKMEDQQPIQRHKRTHTETLQVSRQRMRKMRKENRKNVGSGSSVILEKDLSDLSKVSSFIRDPYSALRRS